MSHAVVPTTGSTRQLDGRAQADEQASASDVQDASKLARLLTRLLAQVAELRRRWNPDRLDFVDLTCSGSGGTLRLEHRMGGRVHWWIIDWIPTDTVAANPPQLYRSSSSTTDDVLVLVSNEAGLASVRVERAG